MEARTCPSCGESDLWRVTYKEGTILICRGCALQFACLAPQGINRGVTVRTEGMLRSTGERYMDPDSLGDPYTYQPYRDFFQHLAARFGPDARCRILDVGCGNGFFLRHCLDRGHDAYGVEVNTELKALMPEDVASRVLWGSAEDLGALPLAEFDVFTFWDSFEHMANGWVVLDSLRPALASQGLVYLRVNNNHDVFNLVSLLALRLVPGMGKSLLKACFGFPSHLWNFSEGAMINLARANGWEVTLAALGETPASRLASGLPARVLIEAGYLANRLIRGGKIGNYYLRRAGSPSRPGR